MKYLNGTSNLLDYTQLDEFTVPVYVRSYSIGYKEEGLGNFLFPKKKKEKKESETKEK